MNDVRDKPSRLARHEIIKAVSARDGYFCYICLLDFNGQTNGKPNKECLTIDHFIPLAHGGSWDISNLRLACQPCNNLKGDLLPDPDGTVNFTKRVSRTPRMPRPQVCETCESGRLLHENEICPDCESGPQPYSFPKYRQRKPKNCDHSVYHCWMCIIGHEKRKPVINQIIMGD